MIFLINLNLIWLVMNKNNVMNLDFKIVKKILIKNLWV